MTLTVGTHLMKFVLPRLVFWRADDEGISVQEFLCRKVDHFWPTAKLMAFYGASKKIDPIGRFQHAAA